MSLESTYKELQSRVQTLARQVNRASADRRALVLRAILEDGYELRRWHTARQEITLHKGDVAFCLWNRDGDDLFEGAPADCPHGVDKLTVNKGEYETLAMNDTTVAFLRELLEEYDHPLAEGD